MATQPDVLYEYVDSASALATLCDCLVTADRIALDTEADSLHHYHEKVCLIQLTVSGDHYIVDPLVDLDLSTFLGILSEKPLIFHSAEYDLRMLRQSFGFEAHREVFDTLLAAQLLGCEQIGLVAMAGQFLDVALTKQGQKSDWSRRPLTPSQLSYACDDTRYLPSLADTLAAKLEKLGRTEWHRESCARQVAVTAVANHRDEDRAWRVKGVRYLKPRQMAFVREIWKWRESEASRADIPAFKIMLNSLILELAVWCEANGHRLRHAGPDLPPHCNGRRLRELESAIDQAKQLPPEDWPQHIRGRYNGPPGPGFDQLRDECARIANELQIDQGVLAPRATLEAIVKSKPRTIDEIMEAGPLMRWQAGLLESSINRLWAELES